MTLSFARVLLEGSPVMIVDDGGTVSRLEGDLFGTWSAGAPVTLPPDVRFLAPVQPRVVAAIGRNYKAHAEELGNDVPPEPLLFLKPASSVTGNGDWIDLPPESERVDHEGELAIVIGRTAKRVPEDQAAGYILGYTAANDVTARDLQNKDGQWGRAKGFDTFCPLGPWIVQGMPAPETEVACLVNGERRQYGHIRDLIFPLGRILAHVSAVITLQPGDVILTGTPSGISPLGHGDRVDVVVSGAGILGNPVRKEPLP